MKLNHDENISMVKVNDKIRIVRLDERCLAVETLEDVVSKKTKKVTKDWLWQGYYGKIEDALIGIINHNLLKSVDEINNINEIIDIIEKTKSEIKEVIKNEKVTY